MTLSTLTSITHRGLIVWRAQQFIGANNGMNYFIRRMTKTPMPLLGSQPNARSRMTSRGYGAAEWKRVEAAMTPTAKKDFLHDLVLDIEKEFMKFNKDLIVRNKTIDGEQISAKVGDKKNIFEFNRGG